MPRMRAPPPAPGLEHGSKSFAKESDILRPVDRRLSDDDWPTFSLYNATVFDKQFTSFTNLLMIEKKGPFPIRGRMVVDYDDERQVSALCSSRAPRRLDIEALAYRMSIGFDLDPDLKDEVPVPAVWAATDYGFFRVLRATPEYRPILDKIFEAITLYYTVLDIHEKHEEREGKKRNRLEVDEVLYRYAVDVGDAAVKEEIVDRCHEHAEFLAGHFPKDPEFDWTGKPFTYFIQKLAKRPRRTSLISQTPVPLPSPSQPISLPRRSRSTADEGGPGAGPAVPHNRTTRHSSAASVKSQSPGVASTTSKSRQGSSQARVGPSKPTATPAAFSGESRSEATALKLYDAIIDANSPDPVSKITIGGITSKLYFKYKFAAYKGAAEAMRYYALELVKLMEGDSERAAEWRVSRIYQELSAVERPMKPGDLQLLTPAKIETSLVRRNKQPYQPRKDANGENRGKTPTAGKSTSETQPRQGRPAGKTGGLRLAATVPKKRFQGDYDACPNGRASKSSKRSHALDYEDEFGEVSSAETEAEEDVDEVPSDGESDKLPVRLASDVEDVPSTRPTGPDGTWMCEQEGCGHMVDDADGADGQMAVREHLHEHEHEAASEKVKLAITEGHAMGHHSIDYLLEKLKKIGGRDLPDLAKPDIERPQPIKQEHGLLF